MRQFLSALCMGELTREGGRASKKQQAQPYRQHGPIAVRLRLVPIEVLDRVTHALALALLLGNDRRVDPARDEAIPDVLSRGGRSLPRYQLAFVALAVCCLSERVCRDQQARRSQQYPSQAMALHRADGWGRVTPWHRCGEGVPLEWAGGRCRGLGTAREVSQARCPLLILVLA